MGERMIGGVEEKLTEKISVRVGLDWLRALQAEAARQKRSDDWLIRKYVKEGLARERRRKTVS